MTRPFVLVMSLLGCVAWLGSCITVAEDPVVFVLEYSIERREGAEVDATHGPHCATAWVDGGRVFVQERNMREVESADAALLVAPQDTGPRTMHLEESYLLALPSSFEAVRGVVLGSLTFEGTGIRLDGARIDLPHE